MPVAQKKVQVINDSKGKPQGVYMDYREYQRLMEDYADISKMLSRLDEPRMSLDQLKKKLKKDGLL